MMVPSPLKRPLAEMDSSEKSTPREPNETDYIRDVLQLEGDTEDAIDEALAREAVTLGIDLAALYSSIQTAREKSDEAAALETSGRLRSDTVNSAVSDFSGSTDVSLEHHNTRRIAVPHLRMRSRDYSKRSLSFSQYDRYLAELEAQCPSTSGSESTGPTPSATSRTSLNNLKTSLRKKLKFRRPKASSIVLQ
jgi:hypothetical protein